MEFHSIQQACLREHLQLLYYWIFEKSVLKLLQTLNRDELRIFPEVIYCTKKVHLLQRL